MSKSLLERYLEIDEEIKALEALKKDLRAEIGELPLGGVPINDQFRMAVTETRRIDPRAVKDLLPESDYLRVLKTAVDSELVKRVVAPEMLDLMYKVSGQTWKIVKRDD